MSDLEIRYREYKGRKGGAELDEVLAEGIADFHSEVMSDQHIWLAFTLNDGRRVHLNFYSVNERAHIAYRVEVDP